MTTNDEETTNNNTNTKMEKEEQEEVNIKARKGIHHHKIQRKLDGRRTRAVRGGYRAVRLFFCFSALFSPSFVRGR